MYLLFFLFLECFAVKKYCDVQCLGFRNGSQTLCLYPDEKVGSSCKNFNFTMNSADPEDITHLHNIYRDHWARQSVFEGRVSRFKFPQASNMMKLKWDNDLANISQRHVNQCKLSFDTCFDTPIYKVGINSGVSERSSENEPVPKGYTIIYDWLEEAHYLTITEIYQYTGIGFLNISIYNLAHILAARTSKIGCGEATFSTTNDTYLRYFVCAYAPKINKSDFMYRPGKACSACPPGTICGLDRRYPSLCDGANNLNNNCIYLLLILIEQVLYI